MEHKNKQNLIIRPPVVVVLGHIDHGKTSILDFIRKAKVVEKESGGITQHIGAYEIEHNKQKITFIDTPGHEAFSAMRSRGTKVADIAILVVDVCEGVKPQTKEAILEIKKSGIPMIVALNKADKIGADQERIKRELSQCEILVESMSGKIPSIETSAKTGQGITDLLELILLIAEMEDLKTDIFEVAEGVVVESYLDNLRGPSATLLLSKGILKNNDVIGTSFSVGKVKSLEDFQGLVIKEAGPSVPVKVIGFEDVPITGETFKVFLDLETAKNCLSFQKKIPVIVTKTSTEMQKTLNLILKTDCLGSAEVVEEILNKLSQDTSKRSERSVVGESETFIEQKVVLKILKSENGEVNESDVKLAKVANALILAFRVKISLIAQNLAEREKVKIVPFQIIYELVERIRNFMERMLDSKTIRTDIGKFKVLINFLTKKNRQIIGGKMIEGEIKKGVLIEVLRNEELVGKGKIINLQRDKKNIEKITKGEECGMLYEGSVKIEEGDILTAYIEEKRKSEL